MRERSGISRQQLRKAFGGTSSNVDRACKRLVQVGYIRRGSSNDYASNYPIDGVGGGDT